MRRRPGPIPEGWGRVRLRCCGTPTSRRSPGSAAVFTAIESMRLAADGFEGWGVVAASRFLGRANLARALQSFLAEGVWGTSPHLIPHFALHSPSGTISLGLGLHGPNLGVGGGLHAAAEGFLAALTWVVDGRRARRLAGALRLVAGADPGPSAGDAAAAGECQALAIAPGGRRHRGGPARIPGCLRPGASAASAPIDLVRLADALDRRDGEPSRPDGRDRSDRAAADRVDRRADGPG